MEQTREAMAQTLAERLGWQAARRDETRVARRLYRKQGVDGVYRLDEGAVLDDVFSFLQQLGGVDWLGAVQGTAVQRERVPFVQDSPALQPEDAVRHREHACPASLAVQR